MAHVPTNSDYQRSASHFAYFCMNYPSNFMDAFKSHPALQKHLQEKFDYAYNKFGASSAMLRFFLELSGENQERLLYWVKENYTGQTL